MFSPKKANKFILCMEIYTILLSLGLSFGIAYSGVNAEKAQLVIIVIQDILSILIPILIFCAITHTKLKSIVPHERLSAKNILYIIFLTLLVSPLITVVSSVTTIFFPPQINSDMLSYINLLPMPLALLAMAIFPAIFEELVFRGVILSNYKPIGILASAIVSGILFGLFHTNFYQMGYAIVAGVFFSFLVIQTNSIYASMFSHFLINGTQVLYTKLAMYYISDFELQELLSQPASTSSNYETIVFGIFLTVIATPFLVLAAKRFMAHNKHHKLDYELSIAQKEPQEFEINISTITNKSKAFVDPFFISYIAITLFLSILYLIYP